MTGDDEEECGALTPEEAADNEKCFTLKDFQEFVEVDCDDPRDDGGDWDEEVDEQCAVCEQAEEESIVVTPVRNTSGWTAVDRSTS